MKIGMVGLGRMGAGMAARLRDAGHEVVGHDPSQPSSQAASLAELVGALVSPRLVWSMVPAGDATESVIAGLAPLLGPGDIVVDGGNSHYRESMRRATRLAERGVAFLDAGVSGGVWGREHGYCLMVGGTASAFRVAEPVFAALAEPGGYAHVGPIGAGHYVKMIHNGVEYALLQAYAEGFAMLEAYDDDLDLRRIASLWNSGSVVRSWLLELAERAFAADPALEGLRGYVDDSGEGRWTVQDAVERGVPAGVIAQSLFARFTSRDDNSFAMRVIAALRGEFGGHTVQRS
jgi:6-phosphogluconate dehydrogenase